MRTWLLPSEPGSETLEVREQSRQGSGAWEREEEESDSSDSQFNSSQNHEDPQFQAQGVRGRSHPYFSSFDPIPAFPCTVARTCWVSRLQKGRNEHKLLPSQETPHIVPVALKPNAVSPKSLLSQPSVVRPSHATQPPPRVEAEIGAEPTQPA